MQVLDSIRKERCSPGQRAYEHRSLFHRPAHGISWTPPSKQREKDPYCLRTVSGDGLVAARHLWHYNYQPTVYYPKQSKNELYQRLATQLKNLGVPFTEDFDGALKDTSHVIDAIFGFSFSGEVREPFPAVIRALKETTIPVTSIDAPSSWDIENGPPSEGPGKGFYPTALVSLTAPKPLAKFFHGRHFLGGRFVSPDIAQKYDLELPEYDGIAQIVELDPQTGQRLKL
ncbi:YjeF N-terminal domain-like protein [Tuber magnatum]|uniref:NAD(P)H-hydrate epimerase n=1 Tax=Tuber magnatum TaxID=42249 RepID=A0A317SKL7_9PEZI|nr:YjeF N-terminal domain-like protein [Tuber magnatum]